MAANVNPFQILFDLHPQPMWVFETSDLRVVAANDAAIEEYGYTREEFLQLSALDLRPSDDHAKFLESLSRPVPTHLHPARVRHRRKDGSLFDVEIAAIETAALDRRLCLVMVNVAGKTSLLNPADVRYRDLVEGATDTVFTLDENWRFLTINGAGEQLTGYTREELVRLSIFDLLAPQCRDGSRRAWSGGSHSVIEVDLRTKAGKWLVIQVSCSRSAAREPVAYQGIARDVTERARAARFDEGRRTVLEMLSRGEPFQKILSQVCEVLENWFGNSLCSIVVPRSGRSELVVWSTAWSDAEGTLDSHESRSKKSRILAQNEQTGIRLSEAKQVTGLGGGRIASIYPYCWSLSTRKVPGESPAELVLYRQSCMAPGDDEAVLMHKVVDLAEVVMGYERLTSQLRHQANHDSLTGLPNRTLFQQQLAEAVEAGERSGSWIGILHIDLDDFKLLNDTEGHVAGDELLGKVAARLKDQLGDNVMLARTGGDEFCIFVQDVEDDEVVTNLARRIIKAMHKPFDMAGRDQFVGVSIGTSLFPRDAASAGSLIKCADVALYRAKAETKGGIQAYHPEMTKTASRQQQIQNRLHHASSHPEEFTLLFQPQLELKTGKLSGMEALLRWAAPGLGDVSPCEFIPIAEQSGLILRIGHWTLREVCRQTREWIGQGRVPGRVAVNVSALQFAQPNFTRSVEEALEDAGLDPLHLELELTESVVMRDFADTARKFAWLRELGIAISIDDFGTGYSSLSYLEKLSVDTLKIDASFTRRIAPGEHPPALVQAIVGLAHSFGMGVIAEGIESEFQADVLHKLGCDKGQGFWISRPVTAESASGMLLDSSYIRKSNWGSPVVEPVNLRAAC